ncbi:MAG: M1 family aminopeptidase [Vulcanimicrobiaceae bacterium]
MTFYAEYVLEGHDSGDPLKGKRDAFEAVAQPIAQQWFGGLVGVKSWSDSWLTTSLTSWSVARAEAKLRPEFRVLPADIDWTWNSVSLWGSLKPLHYTNNDDRDPASYDSFFTSATDSGQAVLDQWSAYVGDPSMRKAVHKFLAKYGGRATTDAAFWKTYGTPQANRYGAAWLNEPGAPVVQATFHCAHSRQILSLNQARIFDAEFHDRQSTVWPVPLSWSTNGKTHWIMLEKQSRQIDAGSCADTTVIDAGFRPTYLVHLSTSELKRLGVDTALTAVDRMRIFRDTFSLITAHQATLPEYLLALHIASRMPRPQSFGYTLRDSLANILRYLAGSRELPIVSKSINDSLRHAFLPEDLHSGKLLNLQNGLYWELAIIPDKRFAREALSSWRKHRSDMRTLTSEDMALMTYAGTVGTSDDFTWVMHHIMTGCDQLSWLPADPTPFLYGAQDQATILRIFAHMQSNGCDYPEIVSRMGYYQPKIVANYIVTHAHDIMRTAPPSQQAWTLTDSIVNGAWAGRTPRQWRAFLQHTLAPRDAPAIHDAMIAIDANWARRRLFEAQLAAI